MARDVFAKATEQDDPMVRACEAYKAQALEIIKTYLEAKSAEDEDGDILSDYEHSKMALGKLTRGALDAGGCLVNVDAENAFTNAVLPAYLLFFVRGLPLENEYGFEPREVYDELLWTAKDYLREEKMAMELTNIICPDEYKPPEYFQKHPSTGPSLEGEA